MKKIAFSYLELIIAMTLVVVVATLAAPLMTGMAKKSSPKYGEFKCYARLVDGTWKLFQNERINSDSYPSEDIEIARDPADNSKSLPCEFTKPVGAISSYTITLYGGGGSGSMPYFDSADDSGIKVAEGENGETSEKKSFIDSLEKAYSTVGSSQILSIYLCDENGSAKNCIGKGGEVNLNRTSMAPKERVSKIIENLKTTNSLNDGDINYINTGCDSECKSSLNQYLANRNEDNKNALISKLNNCNGIADPNKYTGNSGQPTKIALSNGQSGIASKGSFGVSDKNKSKKISVSESTTDFLIGENDLYYLSSMPDVIISNNTFENCNGFDANNPSNIDIYDNYGVGGGGGAFACRLSDLENLTDLNNSGHVTYDTDNRVYYNNHCYEGFGGAGAGGAIIIQWN